MDYGGGPPSDKKYYFVRNAEPGYTFYERGVVNGERKRAFIDAGDARPLGVLLYYLLSDAAGEVSLSILDEQGNEVRNFGKDEIPTERFASFDARGYGQDLLTGEPKATVSKGLNRFVWDMRYPKVSSIPGLPPVVINPIAKPGNYQVRLTVDGQSQTQPFELKINPNEKYTLSETDEKGAFWMELYAKAEEGVQAVLEARAATGQVAGAIEAARGGDQDTATLEALESQGAIVDQICTELETSMVSTGTTLIQIISEPSKPLAQLTMLHNIMETTEGPLNQALREVYTKIAGEMDASKAKFETALSREMARFDELTR